LDVSLSCHGGRLRVNAPKGVVTADLRAQIIEHKAELLSFLLDQTSSPSFFLPSITRRATGDLTPLSFAQERLWFLEQLEPVTAVYNICRASRLHGRLKIAALETSLQEIVRRHEVLRSAVQVVDGCPLQVMVPVSEPLMQLIDLNAVNLNDQEQEIRRHIDEEAARPFDLSVGVFLRCTLLHVGKDDHVLILTTHHIASDAWSIGILRRELWSLYKSYVTNKPCSIKDLPIQYADYAVWQRDRLQHYFLDSQLSYWKKTLEGITVLELPTDRRRPTELSSAGARETVELPESLTTELKELSERLGVTLFMTLVAAFNVLLYRYTGQEDVSIGTPVANRNRPELQGLIGLFVNTLVLRTDLSGNPTFRDLLCRVRETCLAAYVRQDLPFERLVEELHPDRELSRNPLFQVMFVLHNAPQVDPEIFGLRWRRIEVESETAKFDLTLALVETRGRLQGSIEYSTDLFDRATIERMAGHWQTLLHGIVADPNRPIATLPLLTAPERHQLLVTWNDTAADYPKDSCIHELFENQVERTPNRVALQFNGAEMTYKELNQRANQIAYSLIALGVGPKKLVGIYVERSLEMVVSLLAILKTGGAYVPLDPIYPHGRLLFMMQDSKASVLLTSRKLLAKFPKHNGTSIALDDPRSFSDQKDSNPRNRPKADDPAYVIYTSGSTGMPKGVIALHRGAVNRMAWMWRAYPFEANAKSCVKTSLSFVDSVWEIFGPLLQGVPTLIIPDEVGQDIRSLVRTLAEHRVTRIVLVPSLLRAILDERPNLQEELPHQMIWTSSGEHLPRALVDKFQKSLPNHILLNLYGSSEVSADVTCMDLRNAVRGSVISIGRPISNTKIYLLDAQRQPVPIGISGELYVGGAGLARGYLNRPDLTAEKFVADPFDGESGRRLYRTGDLARYRSDGNIEFLGRADNQVKIRGHRIELGEIEAVLNRHPTVRESVVVAQDAILEEQQGPDDPKFPTRTEQSRNIENPEYDKRLIAFVVPTQQRCAPISELRDFLKQNLPDCMVPSFFIPMKALPLTPNGKIDRSALPPPDPSRHPLDRAFRETKTEIEALVAQVWREVLKLDKLGVGDNFFELGGHSLLAVQIVSKLGDAFNQQIPLRTVFEAPTVAAFAGKVESIGRKALTRELPPIAHIAGADKAPLSLSQEQLWYLDRIMPGTDANNMFYVCELSGPLNKEILQTALAEIVKRHGALRTVFAIENGVPVQTVKSDSAFQLQGLDLRSSGSHDLLEMVAKLVLRESTRPFDLTAGPLFRTLLLTLSDQEHLLLISLHHIIGDQWSMRILRSELVALYDAFIGGRESLLSVPAIQFTDYASWERQILDAGLWDGQLAYWRKQLSEPLSRLQFPGAKRKPTGVSFKVARETFEFDEDRLRAIRTLAQRESCTPYMVVLAALNILLRFHTGQSDLRVGSLVANRSRRETENVMGHFLNTTILRTVLSPDMSVIQLLKQIREITIAAHANQELPFEHLVRTFKLGDTPGGQTLCQVLCNYQNVVNESFAATGLRIAVWNGMSLGAGPNVRFTTFDLFFYFWEASTKFTVAVNYKADIFAKRLIARLLRNLDRILAIITSRPGDVLSSILADSSLNHR